MKETSVLCGRNIFEVFEILIVLGNISSEIVFIVLVESLQQLIDVGTHRRSGLQNGLWTELNFPEFPSLHT